LDFKQERRDGNTCKKKNQARPAGPGDRAKTGAGAARKPNIPKLGRLFAECTYWPQVELLDYLREHDFKTFIVSGGGIDLIRAFAEEAYGIARDQVIGSSVKLKFEVAGEQRY
jgi:hypothetical protein